MTVLSTQELLLINGGSEETYAAGKEAGQKVRAFLDDFALAYTIASIVALVVFKVKV